MKRDILSEQANQHREVISRGREVVERVCLFREKSKKKEEDG